MKNLKISTELASVVLGKEVTKCSLISTARSSINITYFEDKDDFNTIWKEWNIYEFAFKCKEWAINQGYQIISGPSDEPAYRLQDEIAYSKVLWYEGDDIHREYKDMYFMANTEVECILKACEWILSQEVKND